MRLEQRAIGRERELAAAVADARDHIEDPRVEQRLPAEELEQRLARQALVHGAQHERQLERRELSRAWYAPVSPHS